jgi:hypothetical protein
MMYMFVLATILAVQGELKVIEPVRVIENLTVQQCVEMLKAAPSFFDLTSNEVRCVKVGDNV